MKNLALLIIVLAALVITLAEEGIFFEIFWAKIISQFFLFIATIIFSYISYSNNDKFSTCICIIAEIIFIIAILLT